MRSGAVKQW